MSKGRRENVENNKVHRARNNNYQIARVDGERGEWRNVKRAGADYKVLGDVHHGGEEA